MASGRSLAVLFTVLGAQVALAAPASAASSEALPGDLDRILSDPRVANAHTGLVVRDPNTDQVLYNRQGATPLPPGSTAKLLTSAAAMDTLGPDYRFRTDVVGTERPHDGVLDGDLHLRGTGDPTVRAADYDQLAKQVADSGVRQVRGKLLADDTWFDNARYGEGWNPDDQSQYFSAPISALTVAANEDYDAGSATVRVDPGAQGQPPSVRVDPETSAVPIDNRATTGPPGSEPSIKVAREKNSPRVVVTGSVPAQGKPVSQLTTVADPTAYARDVFARALAAHGVTVGGQGVGATPPGGAVLAHRDSMPLRELLVPFLKLSNNGHAEVLTKAMGREKGGEGSWKAGRAVIDDRLSRIGLNPREWHLVDGSGLSTEDTIAPEQFTQLLDEVRDRPWFREWYDALPIAGNADRLTGGTLRSRMADTAAQNNLHGKTGSMTGVSALTGSVTTASGRPLVFALQFNGFQGAAPHDLEDSVAVRLAEDGGSDTRSSAPRVQQKMSDTRSSAPRGPQQLLDTSNLECSWTKSC